MSKKKLNIDTMKAAVTTETFNPQPVEEKPIKKSKVGLDSCANCGGSIEKFVVGGGMRFCSDTCMQEFLS